MPYYDRSKNMQTETSIETIDVLQALIDGHGSIPIKLMGDFNVHLPRSDQLQNVWHKQRGRSDVLINTAILDWSVCLGFYIYTHKTIYI